MVTKGNPSMGLTLPLLSMITTHVPSKLDWMIANGKLPEGMQVAVDRFRKVSGVYDIIDDYSTYLHLRRKISVARPINDH